MTRMNFHLTDAQIEGLRNISAKTGVPVAEIIRRLIDAHLMKVKKKMRIAAIGISLAILLAGCEGGTKYTVYERDHGTFDAHADIKCRFVGIGATEDDAVAHLKAAIDSRKPTTCFRDNAVKSVSSGSIK
jgi:hypothetical protein